MLIDYIAAVNEWAFVNKIYTYRGTAQRNSLVWGSLRLSPTVRLLSNLLASRA